MGARVGKQRVVSVVPYDDDWVTPCDKGMGAIIGKRCVVCVEPYAND